MVFRPDFLSPSIDFFPQGQKQRGRKERRKKRPTEKTKIYRIEECRPFRPPRARREMSGRRVLSRGCWAPVSCTACSLPPRHCASSDEFSLQDLPESPSWPFSTPYDITPLDIFFCNELTLCWPGRHNREALDEQPGQDRLGRAIEGRHLQGTRRRNCGTQVLLAISRSWVCCRLQGTDMTPPPPPSPWHGQGWLLTEEYIYM